MGLDLLSAAQRERGLARPIFFERAGPVALEIDRVGQDQPRHGIEHTRADEVLDLVVGLLFHPGVDGLAGPLGARDKIEFLELAAVCGLNLLREG